MAAATGCAKKALEAVDVSGGIGPIDLDAAGAGDGGVSDVGGTPDVAGPIDAAWDLPVSGVRSYVVTSQVSANGAAVTAHTFTLTLDPGQHVAIIGTSGSGEVAPLEQTPNGTVRIAQVPAFGVPVEASCGGSLRYDDLTLAIEADGMLSGSGAGVLRTNSGLRENAVSTTMALTGIPDTEGPALALSASGDPADPWTSLWVVSSEPVPANEMRPVLRSTSGDVLAFDDPSGPSPFFAIVEKPRQLLRFGEQYRITFDGITDFAVNPARWIGDPTFTTR